MGNSKTSRRHTLKEGYFQQQEEGFLSQWINVSSLQLWTYLENKAKVQSQRLSSQCMTAKNPTPLRGESSRAGVSSTVLGRWSLRWSWPCLFESCSFSWTHFPSISTDQFSSVAQSYPTLCNPMNCSTPGLPVHHQLPETTQTHVHWVRYAI